MPRYDPTKSSGSGRGSVDIAIDNADAYEKIAKSYEQEARDVPHMWYWSAADWKAEKERLLKLAAKYHKLAEDALSSGMKDEAALEADPIAATGFDVREGSQRVRAGQAVPSYMAGHGGAALSRRQMQRRKRR